MGIKPSYEMMKKCDRLFTVGSGFPYSEWLPELGQVRGGWIHIDGKVLGIRYPMEVNVIGDSKKILRALIPHLRARRTARGVSRSRARSRAVRDPREPGDAGHRTLKPPKGLPRAKSLRQ